MADEAEEESPYLDEMIEETPLLFASSGAVLTIEDTARGHQQTINVYS